MIDFHSHILPGIDDGSRDIRMTLSMCRMQMEQGIHTILATPHFYANQDSVGNFLLRRKESMDRVSKAVSNIHTDMLPHILPGAEVYYFPGIGTAGMLPHLCIEGTRVLLLEMPFCQWTSQIYQDIKKIVQEKKLIIILAHIERYVGYQKDIEIWDRILKLQGLYPQMNAGAFLNRKKRRFCLHFLENQDVLLGTDCHNLTDRRPNMEAGRNKIKRKFGEKRLADLDDFGERMFTKWINGQEFDG